MNTQEIANKLHNAAAKVQPIAQFSGNQAFDLETAYAVQKATIQHRIDQGHPLVGIKMGFTSQAKMLQMGVNDMIWGLLTQDMLLQDGGQLELSKFIHPRAEPEICFWVDKEIDRALSLEELPQYITKVAAAIEIIDSRYANFKFSLQDVVADNCSSAAFVVGKWHDAPTNLKDLNMKMEINGKVIEQGNSNDILGNPWASVQAATRLTAQYGRVIPAGTYLLAGAATSAVFIHAQDHISTTVDKLGSLSFTAK